LNKMFENFSGMELIDEEQDEKITDLRKRPQKSVTANQVHSKKVKVIGELTLGIVYKISNFGWSQNERLLYVDKNCLCYFSKVPQDFNAERMVSAEVLNRKVHPKISIAIEYILSVELLTDEEKKKHKKKFADGMAAFKVEFDTAGLVNGTLVRTEENS